MARMVASSTATWRISGPPSLPDSGATASKKVSSF